MPPYVACSRCGRTIAQGKVYSVRVPSGRARKCFWCAVRHVPMLRRSLQVAIVVGTVLTALNQGDVLLRQGLSGNLLWKIPLNYLVPFCVASYGALANARAEN